MKKNKLLFTILFSCFASVLYANETELSIYEKTSVINSVFNSDNSILMLNITTEDGWKSQIYAVNPGNQKLHWQLKNLWNKDEHSGSIRSLVYSPFSENFYFYSCWETQKGLYLVRTKNQKKAFDLKAEYYSFPSGLGYLAVNKKGVWLLKDTWFSDPVNFWPYSSLYQVENENGVYTEINPIENEKLRFMSFYRSEHFIDENEDKIAHDYDPAYILKNTDYTLLLRDIDNRSWWNYDCVTNEYIKYSSYNEAYEAAIELDVKYQKQENFAQKNINLIFIILLSLFLVSCSVLVVILIITRKKMKNSAVNSIKERNRITFEIQEKERAKISRDIHDSVVQDIRAIRLETDNLIVDESSKAKQIKIEDIATDCIIKLRNICYNLTPAELTIHNEGESSRIELISIINSLVQQFISSTNVPCVFKIEEGFEYPVLETETTQNVFRVVQEALTNIEKHSYATQASIFIKRDGGILFIYITDNGIGCNSEDLQSKINAKEHLGLRSMMDRMELIGGEIEFLTSQNDGMEVKISLPIEKNS